MKTTLSYQYWNNLGLPGNVPVPVWVVTGSTTTNQLTGSQARSVSAVYTYASPVYDPRENQFLGFQQVTATHPGDAGAPGTQQITHFATVSCQETSNCTGPEYTPLKLLRTTPTYVETLDTSSPTPRHLTTTAYAYNWAPLYNGLDGRRVIRSDPYQQSTYLWNPGTASGQATFQLVHNSTTTGLSSPTIAGMVVPTTTPTVHSVNFDNFGNLISAVDSGMDGVNQAIVTTVTPGLPVGDTTGWSYRPVNVQVGYVGAGATRTTGYAYYANGQLKAVTAFLQGTLALSRQSGMPDPPNQSAGLTGPASVVTQTLTYDAFGNLQYVQKPNGRCQGITYDAAFALLPTAITEYDGGCGSTTGMTMTTQVTFDGGFGQIVQRAAPSLLSAVGQARITSTRYDAFGRIIEVDQPAPEAALFNLTSLAPAITGPNSASGGGVQYNDVGPLRSVHFQTVDGPEDRPYYVDHIRYIDGFGDTVAAVDGSGAVSATGASAQWTVSGVHTRYTNGLVSQAFKPFTMVGAASGLAPTSFAGSSPARSFTYDALGRPVSLTDFIGQKTGVAYTDGTDPGVVLAVTVTDPEQNPSAQHQGSFTTTSYDGHGRAIESDVHLNAIASGAGDVVTTAQYLATGEISVLSQSYPGATRSMSYTRWSLYDSMGRLVFNAEPNTSTNFTVPTGPPSSTNGVGGWTYAYNDSGDLVGTSDARQCGENIFYDGLGRKQSENYIPCPDIPNGSYSAPTMDSNGIPTGDGTEAFYTYDANGRLGQLSDRAQQSTYTYDGRGRLRQTQRQITNPLTGAFSLSARYMPHTFTKKYLEYTESNRPRAWTTGAAAVQNSGASLVLASYARDGSLASVSSSYGMLLASQTVDAMGGVTSRVYGDVAKTTATMAYDNNERLVGYSLQRPAGTSANGAWVNYAQGAPSASDVAQENTFQTVLTNVAIGRDRVGNPTSICQNPALDTTDCVNTPTLPGSFTTLATVNGAQWPSGAQPTVVKGFQYWDDYRLKQATSGYFVQGSSAGGDDSFTMPYTPAEQVPPLSINPPSTRVRQQTYSYDGRGNLTGSTDDQSDLWDRSLGPTSVQSTSPDRLMLSTAGATATGYDEAGNLTAVTAPAATSAGPYAIQYSWDELGRLQSASVGAASGQTEAFTYDAAGQRVSTTLQIHACSCFPSATVFVFDSLVLKVAEVFPFGNFSFDDDANTEQVFLNAGGESFGRVFSDASLPQAAGRVAASDAGAPGQPAPHAGNGALHVVMSMGDTLGSTSFVIDHDTSELVEAPTYLSYGAVESDYRPTRWNQSRADLRYTGHWDDAAVGLVYMGARFYSPQLGRFISPDPLTIHGMGGDPNPYAYARGSPTRYVDPFGLDPEGGGGGDGGVGGCLGCSQQPGGSSDEANARWGNFFKNVGRAFDDAGTSIYTAARDTANWTGKAFAWTFGGATDDGHSSRSLSVGSAVGSSQGPEIRELTLSDRVHANIWRAFHPQTGKEREDIFLAVVPFLTPGGEVEELVTIAAEGITEGTSVLANAARAAENLSASDEAIGHVLERHAFGSSAPNAGKFAADADISALIKGAVSNGVIRPGNATNPSAFVFEQLFSSPVGVTRSGADALGVRVVLDQSGALITAFPF